MDQKPEDQKKNLKIIPENNLTESAISNLPSSSSSSYQQFESNINSQITRNSTFISSKLSLGLIIEKFKQQNLKVSNAAETIRSSYSERKKKFEKILKMYERQQEKSRQNLELYRERQAYCFEEMTRLEGIVQALNEKLHQVAGIESEEESENQRDIEE